jgi:hypothetical protein
MRGYPQFNFPKFMEVDRLLQGAGHEVWNPARKDVAAGLDPSDMEGTLEELEAANFDLRAAIAWDLTSIIDECDTLVLLPGWKESKGAKTEYALARFLGLDVYEWKPSGGLRRSSKVMVLHV